MERYQKMAENTKTKFREALAELLKEKHLFAVTVRDLCKKAGTDRSTFYRYYDSLDEMIEELEEIVYPEIVVSLDAIRFFNLRNMKQDQKKMSMQCMCFMQMLEKNRLLLGSLLSSNGDLKLRQMVSDSIRRCLQDALHRNGFSFGEYERIMLRVIPGIIIDETSRWLNKPDMNLEESANYGANFMINMFSLAKPKADATSAQGQNLFRAQHSLNKCC